MRGSEGKVKSGNWSNYCCLGLLCLLLSFGGGCGGAVPDAEQSPKLADFTVTSYNGGGEDSQYVAVHLQFDHPVAVQDSSPDSFRITIAGNRVKSADCRLEQSVDDARSITLTLQTTAITNGKLMIIPTEESAGYPEITSQDGRYLVQPFMMKCLIPSGVTLETVSSIPGDGVKPASVVKRVVGTWNIRSITWVRLLENGEVVPGGLLDSPEILDGAVAVHGHEFLTSNEDIIAMDIAGTLTDYFGGDYTFRSQGSQVIVEKKELTPDTTIDLQVYLY